AANEVAAHGFCSAEAAPRGDHDDGVVGLLQLPSRSLGADPFDVLTRRLADLVGEDAGEMTWAHCRPAGQFDDVVEPAGRRLDGLLHVADRGATGPRHPDRSGELCLTAWPSQ